MYLPHIWSLIVDLSQEFFDLFVGSDIAHGTFEINAERVTDGKRQGTARVIREATTIDHWRSHLDGKTGLGIIPITSQNNVRWCAIDVDVYSLDHAALARKLQLLNINGVLCRSKSGGGHLYFFLSQSIPAGDAMAKLGSVASFLGYGNCEIFPKQSSILLERGDTGNFLNMPYFASGRSTRYGFDGTGASLSASEFVDFAKSKILTPEEFFAIKTRDDTHDQTLPEGPPCLQHLASQGFGEGSRNNALFNLGVYARQANPEGWEDQVRTMNDKMVIPPLALREVDVVIKQLKKKEYFYKCNDQPIASFCNKEICKTRKFGVGEGNATVDIGSLTKINGDPPIWIMTVDGERLELSTDALHSQTFFQKACISQINKFPPMMSAPAWQRRVSALLASATVVEVPPDTTTRGEFEDLFTSFCCDRARGNERQEILQGIAVWTDRRVFFQIKDLKKHLSVNGFTTYTSNKIGLILKEIDGADKSFWNIRGKGVHVWSVPEEYFGENVVTQKRDFPAMRGEDLL
jgi:hypothetical protein